MEYRQNWQLNSGNLLTLTGYRIREVESAYQDSQTDEPGPIVDWSVHQLPFILQPLRGTKQQIWQKRTCTQGMENLCLMKLFHRIERILQHTNPGHGSNTPGDWCYPSRAL